MNAAQGLRLLCVTAHPDDESLGFGGTLARYAAEGVEVSVVVATRGERGRFGDGSQPHPGPGALGRIREAEARAACEVLGVRDVRFLDYLDAELDQVDAHEATGRIAVHIRALRPHVVLTFDPYGAYGHPDHIAVSQLTSGALMRAASAEPLPDSDDEPHQVKKLYFVAWTSRVWEQYHDAFKVMRMTVDGEVRSSVAWPGLVGDDDDRRSRLLGHGLDSSSVPPDPDGAIQCADSAHSGRPPGPVGSPGVLPSLQPCERRPEPRARRLRGTLLT